MTFAFSLDRTYIHDSLATDEELSMKCGVCGLDYGLTHNCSGIEPAGTPDETAPPPAGFAPLYYLRLAFNIIRWDDVSIRRAARDPKAGAYGAAIWTLTACILLVFTTIAQWHRLPGFSGPVAVIGLMVGFVIGLIFMAVVTLIQLGLCHLIAKWFFGAKGTFIAVLRPLLLGWAVNVLAIIPVIGIFIAGFSWVAVLMLVFEEVNEIGRVQAFLISAGVNFSFLVIQLAMMS